MNRTKIKNYAPQARRDFIQAVTDRAAFYGLADGKIEPATEKGDLAIISGRAFPKAVAAKRKKLVERIEKLGFEQAMEAIAYTWFNRLVAIRYMELHGYLEHGYRVLSNADATKTSPEILDHAEHVELPGLKREQVVELKLAGNKEAELYRMLLIAQCNALHSAMPFLFEHIDDETELLFPENLLHSDSIIRKLVNEIDEEDWQEVEIIGWLYESYIAERYEAVIGSVVASADIPAATQRFTPKWIVRYLVQNTLGRQWLATYPHSALKSQMRYYIEPAEQTPEVQDQLKAITPTTLNPEELTLLDPACGSGHILVEAYDLFKAIYLERGYNKREIAKHILEKNLFGLEIDDRAAQLAALALMMKARADDRRIFESGVQPHVLALQESKGLDAKDITDNLNEPVLTKPLPPSDKLFEDENELFSKANMSVAGDLAQADIAMLIDLFENTKTFGSLIQVPPKLAAKLPLIEERVRLVANHGEGFTRLYAGDFMRFIEQAKLLAGKYDCAVANPPYMGSKYYTSTLKTFVNREYKTAKADLYACFMERDRVFCNADGFHGMINIPNWMFLSSFEKLRKSLFELQTIDTFVHNGRGVFGSDFGSCAFVIRNAHSPEYRGSYRRLFEKQGSVASNEELEQRFHTAKTYTPSNADFAKIPCSPVAYWVSDAMRNAFVSSKPASDLSQMRQGLITGNDARFVRLWHEIAISKSNLTLVGKSVDTYQNCKWFAYAKGGPLRRWYGNLSHVVNWENEGAGIKTFVDDNNEQLSRPQNVGFYFRQGVTWSRISVALPSFRILPIGCIFSDVAPTAFVVDDMVGPLLGYLNTNLIIRFLEVLSPTTHFETGQLQLLPVNVKALSLPNSVNELLSISRRDWDLFESSWDFATIPILQHKCSTLRASQESADAECVAQFARMKELEEENNRLYISAYGLQDELSPDVPDDQITLNRPDREEDIKRLLSYAIGCMMGRYSLDKPGLIYAHSGNEGFDPSQYKKFTADADGIVPLMDADWFADDATNRFIEFLGVAWPKEHLDENVKFVAEAIGPTKNEQPTETIRRYFATGFYKHHLQTYKRRPIYWLFSSGKHRAFQCLVYLHRYNEGTLARMRTEYVIPLQGKITSEIQRLEQEKSNATSTSRRNQLQKQIDKLVKQQAELQSFDESLRHYADRRIKLDLDDGVKVNYAKFGDLLAEVKAVTGGKDEE